MKNIIMCITGCVLSLSVFANPHKAPPVHSGTHKPLRVAKHAVAQPAVSVRKETDTKTAQTK